jgi:hypothetical protein
MKARAYILAGCAVISGLVSEFVPLSLDVWSVVCMGFFPVLFCGLAIFMWSGTSFIQRLGLLVSALLLGYAAEEVAVVVRNGTRVLSDLGPGVMLLLLRFGIAFCSLAAGHLALRLLKGSAEPSAAPNGGPATQLGNSSVTEGPPSVS